MRKLKLLDLFSGIAGFSVGLEMSGAFETVAFCEMDTNCHKVLRKHWPKVPIYEDVAKLTANRLNADGISIDAICGGFPCQDISEAGKRVGIRGARSGLWSEFSRLIGELRPKYVFVENVSELLIRGLDVVLSDLASLGYDAEWHCIQASDVGSPQIRDRLFIIAYNSGVGFYDSQGKIKRAASQKFPIGGRLIEGINKARSEVWWPNEPYICRVAYGVPNQSHRIRMLGNAIVPVIPKIIGDAIREIEEFH